MTEETKVPVVSDEEAAAYAKAYQARYEPPPPLEEKTLIEQMAESKKSAEVQAAKSPPDKDTQNQPAAAPTPYPPPV